MGTELENKSIVRHLDVVEEIVAELRNKVQENKPTASKASSNNPQGVSSSSQSLSTILCLVTFSFPGRCRVMSCHD